MSRRASRPVLSARRTLARRPRFEALESRELLTGFTVTSNADSGPGSLRAAIIAANADNTIGADSISFQIASSGVQTISLQSTLPTITRTLVVDATTEGGYAGTPLVVLDGTNAGASNGLTFGAGNDSFVRGLSIVGFNANASGIVLGGTSSHTSVEADYLGILPDGQTVKPNSNGLAITTANNLVGLTGQANANLISGNSQAGVLIVGSGATHNLLANNQIGTDKTGFFALGNHYGVILAAANNTVGGLTSASRNLISGNLGPNHQDGIGVLFEGSSTGNVVEGNLIGTDITAGSASTANTAAVPNVYGVYFGTPGGSNSDIVAQNTIGGTVSGAGNIISGNVVGITGNTMTSLIAGNMIGLAGPAGSKAIPNGAGILIGATATTIGGTAAAARNVISASNGTNNASGIGLELVGDADTVQGNYIGAYLTSASALTANAALRNLTGVSLQLTNSTIGGTASGAGNVISGNAGDGLVLDISGGNLIQGNSIGLTPDLQGPLPNGGSGIAVQLSTPTPPPTQPLPLNDTIGGTATGAGNTIANNVGSNVIVRGTSPTGYTGLSIRGNSNFGNQLPGIDLTGNGVPSLPRLFITQLTTAGTQNVVDGYFQGAPGATYSIDVFGIQTNAPIAPSNDGPGQVYQGSVMVMTNGSGIGFFSVPRSSTAFPSFTATLTGPAGNTSEFSQNIPALLNTPQADLVTVAFAPSTTVPVGGPVTLIETVTNTGPSGANDVRLVDTLPVTLANVQVVTSRGTASVNSNNVVTALIGSLAPGQSVTVTITGASAQAGPLADAPGVFSSTLDPNYTNNIATQTITVSPDVNTPRADLGITEVATPIIGRVGGNLTYTLTVTNNGPAASDNAIVNDFLPPSVGLVGANSSQGTAPSVNGSQVTANLGTIAPGASATVTLIVRPTTNGTITNKVNVAGGEFDPNPSNNSSSLDTVVGVPSTDLAITKVASPVMGNVGGNLTYTLTVTNNGPATSTNATVTDSLPTSVTLSSVNASQGSVPVVTGSQITADLGTIAPGATATLTVVVSPTAIGTITNTASVVGDQPDPFQDNNSTSVNTAVVAASADLAINAVATPIVGNVGGTLTYTVTVANFGPSAATNATITDVLPGSVAPRSAHSSQGTVPTLSGSTITADLGTIAPGAAATLTILVNPTAAGTITNAASVAGDQPDPNMANNSTSLDTVIGAASADLGVTEVASPTPGKVGSTLTYTVTVTNFGPSTATNVTLNDFLPTSVTLLGANTSQGSPPLAAGSLVTASLGTIAPGATATLTIFVKPTVAGTITNTANVSGSQPDPNPSNNSTSLSTVVTNPNILLTLTTTVSNPVGTVGSIQYFSLAVTNTGTDPATNVTVIDTLPTNALFVQAAPTQGTAPAPVNGVVTANLGTIAPGGKAFLTVVVILTTPGTVINFAGVYTPDAPSVAPSFSNGSITAQPAPLGPSVIGLAGSGNNSQLVLNFNLALNAKSATNLANYVLIATGSKGGNRRIAITAASYNQVDNSVRIVPAAPLDSTITYQLTVIGNTSTGITDTLGRRLVGTLGGAAGTNYVVNFLAGSLPQV